MNDPSRPAPGWLWALHFLHGQAVSALARSSGYLQPGCRTVSCCHRFWSFGNLCRNLWGGAINQLCVWSKPEIRYRGRLLWLDLVVYMKPWGHGRIGPGVSECCPAQPNRAVAGVQEHSARAQRGHRAQACLCSLHLLGPTSRLGKNGKGIWKGDGLSLASPCPATGEGMPSPGTAAHTHCPARSSYQTSCPGSGEGILWRMPGSLSSTVAGLSRQGSGKR